MMSCPASRYSGEGTLADSEQATLAWRTLATDPRFDWIELGNQGYTHSPAGDENLHHHEFAADQEGCNIDHATLAEPEYCRQRMDLIRRAYRTAGIPDERVALIRFPGFAYTPQALRAAAEAGFIGTIGRSRPSDPDREHWVPDAGGDPILEIQETRFLRNFAVSEALEEGLIAGRIPKIGIDESPEFRQAVDRGIALVERTASSGGILTLTATWSDTFEVIGATYPRYLILDAVLDHVETAYGARAWYPRGRELALWLDARRNARVEWHASAAAVEVTIRVPERWKHTNATLDNASMIVDVPAGWENVSGVRVAAEGVDMDLDPGNYWMQGRRLAIVFPLRGRTRLEISGSRGITPG